MGQPNSGACCDCLAPEVNPLWPPCILMDARGTVLDLRMLDAFPSPGWTPAAPE
jgi:hypothetical protein